MVFVTCLALPDMHVVLLIDDDVLFLKAMVETLKRGQRDIKLETATTAE